MNSGRTISGALWLPVLLAASFPLVAVSWAADQRKQPALAPPDAGVAPLRLPAAFSPEVHFWTAHIQRWAVEWELPVELIATVMQIESCGHPAVGSPAGASGLFQVMPYHFAADEQPLDPEVNARRGLGYLARSLELAGGDLPLAMAGYNGGHGVIERPAASWPVETQRYVRWGAGILAEVQRGLPESATLQTWMLAGGASLCRRAAEYLNLD